MRSITNRCGDEAPGVDRRDDPPEADDGTVRRQFVAATASVLAALAGCAGSEDRRDDRERTTPPESTATTATSTATTRAPLDPPFDPEAPLAEKYPGLEVFERDTPLAQAASRATYADFLTPVAEHYVVNHYPSPRIDAAEWTVTVSGPSGPDVDLGMRELREEFSTERVTHTMQCSGNGRAYFDDPDVGGNRLSFGAAGTAVWEGTPLDEVLAAVGADTGEGKWLMAAGGDAPPDDSEPVFARSIPMWKATEDCLLAYRMNGVPLPTEHGFPVRLLVPGWYGNNSVKWLAELQVMDTMLYGSTWSRYNYWQEDKYRVLAAGEEADTNRDVDVFDTRAQMDAEAAGDLDREPYSYEQLVKSQVGRPTPGEVRPRRQDGLVEVVGVAWAGTDRVTGVEVSTDGGETWADAEFLGPDRGPQAWRQFRYLWEPTPGEHLVVSRATDERGRTQPRTIAPAEAGLQTVRDDRFPWNQRGYCANAYLPLGAPVTVSGGD